MDWRVTPAAGDENRPFRIAIDAQVLGPAVSGVERSVAALIRHAPAQAPDWRFVVYHPRGEPMPSDAGGNVSFRPALLPTRRRPIRIGWQQGILPLRLRLDHANLLHAPAYTAPLLCPVPVVLTIYDTIALRFPELSKRLNVLHYRLFLRRSARRAARIIVPSRATRDDVVDMLDVPPEKVRVVPLGVSEEFRPAHDPEALRRVRAELGLPERFILFAGNLEPKKNVPVLIEAHAAAYRSGRIGRQLVIAGRNAWRYGAIYDAVRRLDAQDIVRFTGPVPAEKLPALYSAADLFVFPSVYEGFGLPPLEAMACGTPVIVSRAGALPEVVGDAALSVRPGEVRELRTAIEKALTNQFLARKLSALGRERASAFTWQAHARATVAVYAEASRVKGQGSRVKGD